MRGERERVKRALELGRGGGAELRASGVLHPCSGIGCLLPRVKWVWVCRAEHQLL